MKVSILKQMCLFGALLIANVSFAQETSDFDFERIEDNSFLLEEAYNQEPGVIQHISAFQYMKDKTWVYTFTEEWPVPLQKHQLSTTIPLANSGTTGLGDIAINYRYQAIFNSRMAFSPRISLLLPSGDYKNGLGYGVLGYQFNLPFSYVMSHKIVTHYNLGTTFTPNAKDLLNTKPTITNINYGASVIFLLSETFNFMFEAAGNTEFLKVAGIDAVKSNSFFINPGFRYAINCKSGLQIVPGLALPIGIGPSNGEMGIFVYLSLEHPLWKP